MVGGITIESLEETIEGGTEEMKGTIAAGITGRREKGKIEGEKRGMIEGITGERTDLTGEMVEGMIEGMTEKGGEETRKVLKTEVTGKEDGMTVEMTGKIIELTVGEIIASRGRRKVGRMQMEKGRRREVTAGGIIGEAIIGKIIARIVGMIGEEIEKTVEGTGTIIEEGSEVIVKGMMEDAPIMRTGESAIMNEERGVRMKGVRGTNGRIEITDSPRSTRRKSRRWRRGKRGMLNPPKLLLKNPKRR